MATLSVKYFENTPSVKKSTPSVKMIYAKCNFFTPSVTRLHLV